MASVQSTFEEVKGNLRSDKITVRKVNRLPLACGLVGPPFPTRGHWWQRRLGSRLHKLCHAKKMHKHGAPT